MSAEISDFHKVEEAHADVDEIFCGRGVERMVDKVGYVSGEAPVVDGVFE